MTWLNVLSRPDTLALLVPIVALLMFGILSMLKVLIKHRERMAMIEQGMHPDVEPHEAVEEQEAMV